MPWSIEYAFPSSLDSLAKELSEKQFEMLIDGEFNRLAEHGLNLLKTHSMKSLGGGLFELRIRKDPEMLVRVFLTLIHPSSLVIVGGYNKKRDPSELRQRREIKAARKLIDDFQGTEYSK